MIRLNSKNFLNSWFSKNMVRGVMTRERIVRQMRIFSWHPNGKITTKNAFSTWFEASRVTFNLPIFAFFVPICLLAYFVPILAFFFKFWHKMPKFEKIGKKGQKIYRKKYMKCLKSQKSHEMSKICKYVENGKKSKKGSK